jgi:homoserine kinase
MRPRKKSESRLSSKLELILPATSANLGPAFDAAAVALALHRKIQARAAADYAVSAHGRDAEFCAETRKRLMLDTYCEVLQAEGRSPVPLAVKIDNRIPVGKGCGSSAAARLAGIALAVHFGNLGWSDSRIVGEASRREHHPDNAAACWMGGLAIARMSSETEAQVVKVKPEGKWPLLLALPPHPLSTEKARRVLPAQYDRSDAVSNVQNAMLLLAAFVQGRRDLLATALQDRIHQPYRAPLCPLLPPLQAMAGKDGVLGAALSGAGPSVMVFLDPSIPAKRSKAAVACCLRQHGLFAELLLTSIAAVGAGQCSGWKNRKRPHR